MGECQRDMAFLAQKHGHGDPQGGAAGPRASLLAEGGRFRPPAAAGGGCGLVDEFPYRLYGMYLAVLAARMAAVQGNQAGDGDSLFPDQPHPRARNPYH